MNSIIRFLILFLSIGFIDLFIFTYLHELSHQRALKKAGIVGVIRWNIKENIKHISIKPWATCFFDERKLKNISYYNKKEVFLSGIKMDLIILLILSILSIFTLFLLIMNIKTIWLYYTLILLNTLILIEIWNVIINMFKKNSDLDKFFKFV